MRRSPHAVPFRQPHRRHSGARGAKWTRATDYGVPPRKRYADYTTAREAMFAVTHTAWTPWTMVDFNDHKRGHRPLREKFRLRKPIGPYRAPDGDD